MNRFFCIALLILQLLTIQGLFAERGVFDILDVPPKDRICFAMYTLHHDVLKLTAQLYPIHNSEDIKVRLDIQKEGKWVPVAETEIVYPGFTAPFRIENWETTIDVPYRLSHMDKSFYGGVIRKDPVDKEEIIVAAFTGNSHYDVHGGEIPKTDILNNLKKIKPDLLFFSGDQIYEHSRHLSLWLRFGREFGEIMRNTPTVCIPDDHDVGQYNIWGASGKKATDRAGTDGGFYMPVEFVNEVQRAQTSHLPDPYDPTPIDRGIGVYYTNLTIGRVSFAIIEDRKFKTGPDGLVTINGPRPDHLTDPNQDPKELDVPEATLLGERQLEFLKKWGQDWVDCDMKAVLSQTIFCGGAHIHGKVGGRLLADLDSNGWPQTGRNKAIEAMRKAFALHIAGDQHLATVFHHGINDWNDGNYSLCVPSIANLYLRWWEPLEPGKNRKKGAPEYTGEHVDGFGNKVTCWAVANPSREPNGGSKLTTRAAGFGLVYFNKTTRKIRMEIWPRNVDVTDPVNKPYPGWPVTIDQQDNYGREAVAYLPELKVEGAGNPVIQIINESNNEVEYTLRIKGNKFRPKVFKEGFYTIRVFDRTYDKRMEHVESVGMKKKNLKITI